MKTKAGSLGAVAVLALMCSCKTRVDDASKVTAPTSSSAAASQAAGEVAAVHVAPSAFKVTSGRVRETASGLGHIDEPTTRFVAPGTGSAAEMTFTYRGPTAKTSKLASGEIRKQLGIKLRAKDGCNVVYAMWRFDPEPKVVVSVKRNETASASSECGADGYSNVTPTRSAAVPAVAPGATHVMDASIVGERLVVHVDKKEVWEGPLPQAAFEFDGPAGARTDNVDVELAFSAKPRSR